MVLILTRPLGEVGFIFPLLYFIHGTTVPCVSTAPEPVKPKICFLPTDQQILTYLSIANLDTGTISHILSIWPHLGYPDQPA